MRAAGAMIYGVDVGAIRYSGSMSIRARKELTQPSRFFLEPRGPLHRQYEALRAYHVEELPSAEAARRFGYSPGAFRVLCHRFRHDPERDFFASPGNGPQAAPKKDSACDRVIELRKQNLSIYDISGVLDDEGRKLSPAAVQQILKAAGFAKLPRRADDERPAGSRPDPAAIADKGALDLSPRSFRTKFGGIFLFMPFLAKLPLDSMLAKAGFPGSDLIPAGHATRALLALKLFGSARHSHVMSNVFDEGLALFAGLNVTPKRSFLTEYSCRIEPKCYPKFMARWFDAVKKQGLAHGDSFDLDFHAIPFHGEDALIQKHYTSKRSRSQKAVLAFLAQDSDRRVFCYANSDLRKDEANNEILRFVDYWKKRTGRVPEELVFDSKVTTYENLDRLNKLGIKFITLRARNKTLAEEIRQAPASAWKRITLQGIARTYRTPRILDKTVKLSGYDGSIRQIAATDLGHAEPTVVLTNQLRRSPSKVIGRYAQRMLIENGISDGVDFFHMDALSSAVAMKVSCDLQLTLMASSLYRLLGAQIGRGYETARARHIFRDFVDATAKVTIDEDEIRVRFQKRAHNPLLLAAGLAKTDVAVPWLGGKRLRLVLG